MIYYTGNRSLDKTIDKNVAIKTMIKNEAIKMHEKPKISEKNKSDWIEKKEIDRLEGPEARK